MGPIEQHWRRSPSRRKAMLAMAGVAAASPLLPSVLSAQQDPRPLNEHKRTLSLDEMMTAFDFEPVMFANVPLAVYDYTAHGDGSEFTLRRNRQAFDWVDLVPGPAIDPAVVDLSCELFGTKLRYPILVAPTATMVPLHPDGEIGMHRAATAASNTPMIVSHNTSTTIDRIAAGATGPLWWQLYPSPNLDASREILDGAQAAGCTAVVITVDQQASYYERSAQDRNLGGRGGGGGRGGAGGRGAAPAVARPPTGAARYRIQPGRLWYNWRYLDDLHKTVKVPFLLKGIVTAEDARLAVEHGVDGIIVSNHGGRSMDYGPSTLEVLPEIVAAVNGRIPVITDSGYRRGTDILKGLALGASAVLLGRTTRWALAAFGTPGAQRLLEMMQRELVDAAAAAGRRTMASIDRTAVKPNFT